MHGCALVTWSTFFSCCSMSCRRSFESSSYPATFICPDKTSRSAQISVIKHGLDRVWQTHTTRCSLQRHVQLDYFLMPLCFLCCLRIALRFQLEQQCRPIDSNVWTTAFQGSIWQTCFECVVQNHDLCKHQSGPQTDVHCLCYATAHCSRCSQEGNQVTPLQIKLVPWKQSAGLHSLAWHVWILLYECSPTAPLSKCHDSGTRDQETIFLSRVSCWTRLTPLQFMYINEASGHEDINLETALNELFIDALTLFKCL